MTTLHGLRWLFLALLLLVAGWLVRAALTEDS